MSNDALFQQKLHAYERAARAHITGAVLYEEHALEMKEFVQVEAARVMGDPEAKNPKTGRAWSWTAAEEAAKETSTYKEMQQKRVEILRGQMEAEVAKDMALAELKFLLAGAASLAIGS